MTVTVDLAGSSDVRLTEQAVTVRPPDEIGFVVEGTATRTESLLAEFEGRRLDPARVELAVGESGTVEVDLTAEASIRLESVDVGVETPDTDDLLPEDGTVTSAAEDAPDPSDSGPAALAFTVEGVLEGVPEEVVETVADASPTFTSLTFAVEESLESDGGSRDEAMCEFDLLGFTITVGRDGRVRVGTAGVSVGMGAE